METTFPTQGKGRQGWLHYDLCSRVHSQAAELAGPSGPAFPGSHLGQQRPKDEALHDSPTSVSHLPPIGCFSSKPGWVHPICPQRPGPLPLHFPQGLCGPLLTPPRLCLHVTFVTVTEGLVLLSSSFCSGSCCVPQLCPLSTGSTGFATRLPLLSPTDGTQTLGITPGPQCGAWSTFASCIYLDMYLRDGEREKNYPSH